MDGTIHLGERITVHATISPGRAFPVKVTTLDAPHTMVWTGGMPLGLFKGVRTFTLTPRADGTTDFHMKEIFSGPMLGLIKRSMPDLTEAFQTFAADLGRAATA